MRIMETVDYQRVRDSYGIGNPVDLAGSQRVMREPWEQREVDRGQIVEWAVGLARWDVFGTWTYRWEASLWSARGCFVKFMGRFYPHVPMLYAIERNPSRDGHHVHAVLATQDLVRRKLMWQRWFLRFGRNRVEPIETSGAVPYLTKYVWKKPTWWDVVNVDRRVLVPGESW